VNKDEYNPPDLEVNLSRSLTVSLYIVNV